MRSLVRLTAVGIAALLGSTALAGPVRDQLSALRTQLSQQQQQYLDAREVRVVQHAIKLQLLGGLKIARGTAHLRIAGTERRQRVSSVGVSGGTGWMMLAGVETSIYKPSDRVLAAGRSLPKVALRQSAGAALVYGVDGFTGTDEGGLVGFGAGANFFPGSFELNANFVGPMTAARPIRGLRVSEVGIKLADQAIAAYDAGEWKTAENALPRLARAAQRIAADQERFHHLGP